MTSHSDDRTVPSSGPTESLTEQQLRPSLVTLSHHLGDPAADLAILGEGNTSAALSDGTFLVKASGCSLHDLGADDFVRVDATAVVDLVDSPLDATDESGLSREIRAATVEAGDARPSIEVMLHALALALPGVTYAAHTHPTAVNALLCSDQADLVVQRSLFPDQVVVCGAERLLVPYAEPGLALGRAFAAGLRTHLDRHGTPPRLVYLGNHGIVALGDSPGQVIAITQMAVKAARILSGALAVGAPVGLPSDSVRRLDQREDEVQRRRMLTRRAP